MLSFNATFVDIAAFDAASADFRLLSPVLQASWPPANNKYPLATFAAGCFWGVELAFQRQPGVIATAVGYVGGNKDNPTYEQVSSTKLGPD